MIKFILILYFAAAPSIGLVFPPAKDLHTHKACQEVGEVIYYTLHNKHLHGMDLSLNKYECVIKK